MLDGLEVLLASREAFISWSGNPGELEVRGWIEQGACDQSTEVAFLER